MLLGHGSIGQFAVAEALSGLVVNAGTVDVLFSDDSLILMLAVDRKLVKAPFVRLR